MLEDAARKASGENVLIEYAGESRQIRHEGTALTATLGFALILIYLVLAAQFQSFRDPLIVLLGSVPLAISGVLYADCRGSSQAGPADQARSCRYAGRAAGVNGTAAGAACLIRYR